jgi:hypothetical protein
MADAHKAMHEHHKSMATHHTEHAATHKAIHEHFKAAAEEGGEHAEHHAMHADAHKAHHEHHKAMAAHHETKAAHHMALHKNCAECATKCGKLAEEFAPTPEKKAAIPALIKTAREALPKIAPPAAPAPAAVDTSRLSASEKAAFESVQAAWLNSDEYKKLTTDALRAQTVAKLTAAGNSAAIAVGIDSDAEIYQVPRPGQVDKSQTGTATDGEIFDFLKK